MRASRFLSQTMKRPRRSSSDLSEDQIMMLAKRSCYWGKNMRGSECDPTRSFTCTKTFLARTSCTTSCFLYAKVFVWVGRAVSSANPSTVWADVSKPGTNLDLALEGLSSDIRHPIVIGHCWLHFSLIWRTVSRVRASVTTFSGCKFVSHRTL